MKQLLCGGWGLELGTSCLSERPLPCLSVFDRINKNKIKLIFEWDDNLGLTSLHLKIDYRGLEK